MSKDNPSHVSVDLVPLVEHISPGHDLELAVVFTMLDDWYIYWQNPGDAGMATFFEWQLPDGFELTSKQEPAPVRHTEEGITTFIHEEEAIYLFTLSTPADLSSTVSIGLNVNWLECKSICLSGSDTLKVVLPVSSNPPDLPLDLLELGMRARSRMPRSEAKLTRSAKIDEDELTLRLNGFHQAVWDIRTIDFFPADELIYDISTPPELKSFLLSKRLILPLLPDREMNPGAIKGVLAIRPYAPKSAKTQYYYINRSIRD